ncbi:hypothetical protein BJX99DRAFT_218417 [Aspergillus californicus]
MTGTVVVHKRGRTKVKTGCTTCRIRKVKCDEDKPFCQKCVKTGRTCDGYESPFRFVTSLEPVLPAFIKVAPQEIHLLNRYFSTKTIFDVNLGCVEEARQVIQASLSNPPIQHAIVSLKALREDLELSGDGAESIAQQTPSFHYGIQQYSKALGGLASNLSSPGPNGLKSALLCCQIFISIEQVQKNYAAMAQHIIRGLRIMHQNGARPSLIAVNNLVPANPDQLPFLDVFIIKLFAAPCKFADLPAPAGGTGQQPVVSRDLRIIAPDMRTELTRIAASTLEFLAKVSEVESIGTALQLLSEKAALLDSLESWILNLEVIQTEIGYPKPEPISVSFLRFFYLIMRIVLLGALDSSLDLYNDLRTETNQLQGIASYVGERVRTYRTSSGTSSARERTAR